MRNISHVTQHATRYYAQNVSIIPLYNKIFVDGRSRLKPEGFDGDNCFIDPDLPIYRQQWIEYNASAVANVLEIENWIRMNGGQAPISWSEWINLDFFVREAIKMISNKITKEMNKQVKQKEADLTQKMEANKPYQSVFNGTPSTPSFIK